jgi:hypothetical protein
MIFPDCSCKEDCTRKGNCCSDYKLCEIISENIHINKNDYNKETMPNCKYDSLDRKTCYQCEDNYYYYEGKCLDRCPDNTNSNDINKICDDAPCPLGLFIYKGDCFSICPEGTKANRINYKCEQKDSKKYFYF